MPITAPDFLDSLSKWKDAVLERKSFSNADKWDLFVTSRQGFSLAEKAKVVLVVELRFSFYTTTRYAKSNKIIQSRVWITPSSSRAAG
jgi:hypothetical protein